MTDNNVIINFIGNPQSVVDASKKVDVAIKETAGISQQANAQFVKQNADTQQALNKTEKSTAQLAANFKSLTQSIPAGVTKMAVKDFNDLGNKLVDTTKKFASAKAELHALANELTSGKLKGDALITATQRAAHLKDEISDTSKAINMLASDTRAFDLLVEGARGVTAAFSIAQGATALLGEDNKELQQSILKVQGALATLTGVQEIANVLITKGGITTKAYGIAVGVVETISRRAGISMAASWALATGGISLVITAIVGLIAYFSTLENKVADVSDQILKMGEAEEYFNKKLLEQNEDIANSYEKKVNSANRIVELLKAQHADALKINLAEKNSLLTQKESYDAILKADKLKKEDIPHLKEQLEYQNRRLESEKAYAEAHNGGNDALKSEIKGLEETISQIETKVKIAEQYNDAEEKSLDIINKIKINEAQRKDIIKARLDLEFASDERKIKHQEEIDKQIDEHDKEIKKLQDEHDIESNTKKLKHQEDLDADLAAHDKLVKDKKKADERQYEQLAISTAKQTSDAIFQIQSTNRSQILQDSISKLETQRAFELNNKNLTEEQRAAIDKKFKKKEAEERLKAFEADKRAKTVQAVINTALAVTNAFATAPTIIAAIPLAAAAAAAGAIEIAVIQAQKAPAFAKGTKNAPAGMKWVGEQGPELINDGGGYAIIPNHDAMKIAEKWDVPTMPSFTPPMPNAPDIGMTQVTQERIDYNKLGTIIAEKLRANPQTVVNIDKGGFAIHVLEKGRKVERLNNRYSSK